MLLVGALAYVRMNLGWVLYDGLCLDASAWQQLLEQKLVPFFTRCYVACGDPPAAAAVHAAAAAAVQSRALTFGKVLIAIAVFLGAAATLYYRSAKAVLSKHSD